VLDKNTALHFVEKYLYLNRHFCPQLFWLFNLKRFSNAKYNIQPIQQIETLTTRKQNQSQVDLELAERFAKNIKLKFHNEIDEVLTTNLLGQTVSLEQIMDVIKSNYNQLYNEIFDQSRSIMNVVP
jgi:hypothetical protein